MKIQTINQLISVWRDIATRHYQINGFGIGDSWEVGVEGAYMHPVLWINPVTANMPSSENGYKTFEIDFEVRIFDLVNKDESNENHVLSDTIDILKDIIAEFKGHPYYVNSQLNIIGDIDFEAFTEEFDEEVSGWLCEISLMTPVLTTFCGIPSADITGFEFPGIDCPDFNVLCPVIISEVSGSYPIVVTPTGSARDISLNLAGVPDTFIVSGVYSGGTLTLTRNDTAEIEVTGFTDENDFTNGVTLDGNILRFDRTDLADAYNIDLTPILTGEVNTSSNSGTGEGLALAKVGSDLPFKTIKAGTNITLTPSATEILISSAGGTDTNIGNSTVTFDATRTANLNAFEWLVKNGTKEILRLSPKGTGGRVLTNGSNVNSANNFAYDGASNTVMSVSYGADLILHTFYLEGYDILNSAGTQKVFSAGKSAGTGYMDLYNGTTKTVNLKGSGSSYIRTNLEVKGSDTSSSTTGFEVLNSASTSLLKVKNNGVINASNLPTSSVGLSAGDIWNNAGVLNIV